MKLDELRECPSCHQDSAGPMFGVCGQCGTIQLERLSEAEATVALDRDDESGTRLVVPEEAKLTNTDGQPIFDVLDLKYGNNAPPEALAELATLFADVATEKAYPMGFNAGSKSRDGKVEGLQRQKGAICRYVDELTRQHTTRLLGMRKQRDAALAEVAELKHKLFSAEELSEMWHLESIAIKKEHDANRA